MDHIHPGAVPVPATVALTTTPLRRGDLGAFVPREHAAHAVHLLLLLIGAVVPTLGSLMLAVWSRRSATAGWRFRHRRTLPCRFEVFNLPFILHDALH